MIGTRRFSYCILSLLKLVAFLVYYYYPVAFFLCTLDEQIIIIVLCFTGVNALIIHALIELFKKIVVLWCCCFVVFSMFVCLQHFSALLYLVYHDCIPMSCPRSVESATQGGSPARHNVWCEVTWQHVVGILRTWVFHIKGIQVYGDL